MADITLGWQDLTVSVMSGKKGRYLLMNSLNSAIPFFKAQYIDLPSKYEPLHILRTFCSKFFLGISSSVVYVY